MDRQIQVICTIQILFLFISSSPLANSCPRIWRLHWFAVGAFFNTTFSTTDIFTHLGSFYSVVGGSIIINLKNKKSIVFDEVLVVLNVRPGSFWFERPDEKGLEGWPRFPADASFVESFVNDFRHRSTFSEQV